MLVGTLAAGLIGGFLLAPNFRGEWVDPPAMLRDLTPAEDLTRVALAPAGMHGAAPTWITLRRRVYFLDRPNLEVVQDLDAQLRLPTWSRAGMYSLPTQQGGMVYQLSSAPPTEPVTVQVYQITPKPPTRVEFQQIRRATLLERAVDFVRRPFERR